MSFIKKIGLVCFIVFCCAGCRSAGEKPVESAAAPRIINIINFILIISVNKIAKKTTDTGLF